MHEHHYIVPRTARSFVIGGATHLDEIWFVMHGYAELASQFIQAFLPFATDRRRIVAPEGLSRFYRRSTQGEVGASWMTSEAREYEIADQLHQLEAMRLDATHEHGAARIKVLGFSQGVATACRWLARTDFEVERLVLWGGGLPPDLTDPELARLRQIGTVAVYGETDRYLDNSAVEREMRRMKEARIKPTLVRFEGGHNLDETTIERVLAR